MKIFFREQTIIYYLLLIYFFVGTYIFKDFGIGIEEHFQRSSGFYWLNYLVQFSDFETIKNLINQKVIEINNLYPNLPPIKIAQHYGIVFDVPMAFIETIFKIDNSENQFYLRHFFTFFIFLISGFLFYLLILKRTKNYTISLISCCFYLLSPRVFGNSFFDGKDLFFLSLLTINFYLYSNYCDKKNFNSILILSIFSAFSTSTRIIGLFFPISFILIFFLEIINKNYDKKIIYHTLVYLVLYFLFLFAHWPYLWTIEIGLFNFFYEFSIAANPIVLFGGDYYTSEYLPLSYIPIWLVISIPEIIILFFILGFSYYIFRLFKRFSNIKNFTFQNDLWRGSREKKDLFIFLCFFQIIVIYLSFNLNLYGGWRHFLFLSFFITYFSSIGIYIILLKFKNIFYFKKFFFIILSFFIFEIAYNLFKYHPFQSVYFNNFVSSDMKNKYEVDTQSLSRVTAIREIIRDSKDKKKVIIGTASWTPLENGRSLIDRSYWNKLYFTGTSSKEDADYIFSNHYYEVNPQYSKKYKIPNNFELFKTLSIDNTLVYSIYKKNQK